MEPYRHEKAEEFNQWLATIMEEGLTAARDHPVTKHIQEFVTQHKVDYVRLRRADLARYPGVGQYLSDYKPATGFQDIIDKEQENGTYSTEEALNIAQYLNNHRALRIPSLKIALPIVRSYVSDWLSENNGNTVAGFSRNSLFGEKVFVDDIDGDQYRVTFLNRLYALQCDWNIHNNRISIPSLYVYHGERQPPRWLAHVTPIANDAEQSILGKLEAILWTMYDEMGPDRDIGDVLDKFDDRLESFYRDNHSLYIDTRDTLLSRYPKVLAEKWANYPDDAEETTNVVLSEFQYMPGSGHSLPLYAAVYALNPETTALTIETASILATQQRYLDDLNNWILGLDIRTQKVDDNLWEIHYFFDDFATRYTSEIATDEISELVVKSK